MKDFKKHREVLEYLIKTGDFTDCIDVKKTFQYFISLADELENIEGNRILPEERLPCNCGECDKSSNELMNHGWNECRQEIKLRLLKKLDGLEEVLDSFGIWKSNNKRLADAIRNHILGKE